MLRIQHRSAGRPRVHRSHSGHLPTRARSPCLRVSGRLGPRSTCQQNCQTHRAYHRINSSIFGLQYHCCFLKTRVTTNAQVSLCAKYRCSRQPLLHLAIQRRLRPSIFPSHRRDMQRRSAIHCAIRMKHYQVFMRQMQQRFPTRPSPRCIRHQHRRASTLRHRPPLTIHIRPRHTLRSPHHRPVRALRSTATQVPAHKQVVVPAMTKHKWSLHRLRIRRQIRIPSPRLLRLPARSQRIQLLVRRRQQSRLPVQLPHHNPRPEAPKRQPRIALRIDHQVRIDRIKIILHKRPQHQPAIHPLVLWARPIQSLIRRQRNSRRVLPKCRKRVVEVILPPKKEMSGAHNSDVFGLISRIHCGIDGNTSPLRFHKCKSSEHRIGSSGKFCVCGFTGTPPPGGAGGSGTSAPSGFAGSAHL